MVGQSEAIEGVLALPPGRPHPVQPDHRKHIQYPPPLVMNPDSWKDYGDRCQNGAGLSSIYLGLHRMMDCKEQEGI